MKSNSPFRGRFELKVDPKFRLTLPSAFRDLIQTSYKSHLVITNSQSQGHKCLDVFPLDQWKKLEGKVAKLPQLKMEVQNFQRFYLSGGHEIDLDSQGRILIPPMLRQYASVEDEVVVVGFAEKFEIWAAKTWNKFFQTLADDFEKTMGAVGQMGENKNHG
jgi:MraZ protein